MKCKRCGHSKHIHTLEPTQRCTKVYHDMKPIGEINGVFFCGCGKFESS